MNGERTPVEIERQERVDYIGVMNAQIEDLNGNVRQLRDVLAQRDMLIKELEDQNASLCEELAQRRAQMRQGVPLSTAGDGAKT